MLTAFRRLEQVSLSLFTFVYVLVDEEGYGEGVVDLKHPYLYVKAIVTASQVVRGSDLGCCHFGRSSLLIECACMSHLPRLQWALYCLLHFYHALSTELRGLGALSKLLVVKALVFFTFW